MTSSDLEKRVVKGPIFLTSLRTYAHVVWPRRSNSVC